MKQLGGLDASFLYMETPQTPMHVASLSIVEVPPGFKGGFYDTYKAHLAARLHLFPVLLKMRYGHNSYGIDASSVVGSREALLAKLRSRGPADAELVIEQYIDGPEATAGFVGDRQLPPFTIAWGPAFDGQPKILGTASKWDEGSVEYQQSLSVPGDFSPALVAQLDDSLRRAAECLLVDDYGRCDFRVRTEADGREVAYAIDVNANPDLHRGAGLFRMAAAAGLTYPEMVHAIVSSALARPPRRPAQGLDSGV